MKTISFFILFSLLTGGVKECQTKNNDMDTITVKAGDTFDIVLRASPSTGYQWLWVEKEKASIVDSIGVVYLADKENLPGSPGNQIWKFKALKKGTTTIKFEYRRPWEDKNKMEDSKEIYIFVKK